MRANFNISITRFFVCIYLLLMENNFPAIDYSPEKYKAVGIFHLLPGPISDELFLPIRLLWMLSLFLAAFGWARPFSTGFAVLGGTYVMAYSNCFGLPIIGTAMAYTFLWLFFLAEFGRQPEKFLKLMQVLLVLYHFIPGIQKLRFVGADWVLSENLATLIYYNRMTPTATWLLSLEPIYLRILAGIILVSQLLSPLALIGKRTALILVCLWASFHIGTQIVFDFHRTFLSSLPCLAIFFDWSRVLGRWPVFKAPTS